MEYEKCLEGYGILNMAFSRKLKESDIRGIWGEFFRDVPGGQFRQACKLLAKESKTFPVPSDIFDKMREITIEPAEEYEKPRYCSKCWDGLIDLEVIVNGQKYIKRAVCDCGAQKDSHGNEKYTGIMRYKDLKYPERYKIVTHDEYFRTHYLDAPGGEQPTLDEERNRCKGEMERLAKLIATEHDINEVIGDEEDDLPF